MLPVTPRTRMNAPAIMASAKCSRDITLSSAQFTTRDSSGSLIVLTASTEPFIVTIIPAMKLSVVMPVYNEQATLKQVVERVLAVPLEIELICVDDGSTDGSRDILAALQVSHPQ